MLRSGVNINTIRAWLVHDSLDTTNIFADEDLKMKEKTLASVDVSGQLVAILKQRALL